MTTFTEAELRKPPTEAMVVIVAHFANFLTMTGRRSFDLDDAARVWSDALDAFVAARTP